MAEADGEAWDARYREGGGTVGNPSAYLVSIDDLLPRSGNALDVAGGTGRNALWLARRGLATTLADISPAALGIAQEAAAAQGISLPTRLVDLETEPFPAGPWDLIVCVNFLLRELFAVFPGVLAAGGLLVVEHPTRSNLLRHQKPGPRHLLDDGELAGLITGLEILRYEEGWTAEGRHVARLAARKGF